MKNSSFITTAANSKTMNAIEKDRLFAATPITEEDPATIDIKEFEAIAPAKKTVAKKNGKSAKKR